MGVWIEELKRLIRVWFRSYTMFWGVLGVFFGCAFNSLVLFIPVCLCLGYYFEAKYQERMGVGNGKKK